LGGIAWLRSGQNQGCCRFIGCACAHPFFVAKKKLEGSERSAASTYRDAVSGSISGSESELNAMSYLSACSKENVGDLIRIGRPKLSPSNSMT
jgi:hypothetical protein